MSFEVLFKPQHQSIGKTSEACQIRSLRRAKEFMYTIHWSSFMVPAAGTDEQEWFKQKLDQYGVID